jgi:predicted RNA-binding Zn ribbon-like protein
MSTATPYVFELDGGRVSLDFVNTVGGMRGYEPKEHLHAYADLLEFARQSGVVSDDHARRLAKRAAAEPEMAIRVFRRAIEFREALFRLWSAWVAEKPIPETDLEIVNAMVTRGLSRQKLIPSSVGSCCALGWEEADDLEVVLWPVAKDAADLLASEKASRVRMCEMSQEHECSWVFLDETKNGKKRWCSMQTCGNRAKARRFAAKQRAES